MKRLKNVFALAPDCHTPINYSHLAWRRHFYDGIRPHTDRLIIPEELDYRWARQGPNVDTAPFAAQKAQNNDLLFQRIRRAHQEHGLDAVLTYCFAFDLDPQVVTETIRLGVPWINFFCDSTHLFEKLEPLARVVSLNWFPETAAIPRYEALGAPWICAPYAWNPEWLPDLTNETARRTISFIGLPTANRITQLGWMRVFGCHIDIRGRGWIGQGSDPFYNAAPARQRAFKALFQKDLSEKVMRRLLWPLVRPMAGLELSDSDFNPFVKDSLMILGLNQGKDAQGRLSSYMKYRDMEFPGYGCCYLTEHNEDVPRVFEVGKEILTYRSSAEAASHVRRMKKNPEQARAIGRAGRRRVLESHSWGVRLQQLAERL